MIFSRCKISVCTKYLSVRLYLLYFASCEGLASYYFYNNTNTNQPSGAYINRILFVLVVARVQF